MKNRWLKIAFDDKNDERVLEIRAEFGAAGYGMLWLFRTTLAENQGKISTTRLAGLSVSMGVDMQTLKAFIQKCQDVGIAYVDSDNFIHCKLVDEQLNAIEKTSVKAKESVSKRWENLRNNAENTVVLQPNYERNTDKRREEKIREEKSENTRSRKRSVSSDEVESIYGLYPYKKARGAALVAIEKAIRELTSKPHLIEAYLQTQADKLAHLPPERLLELKKPVTFLSARVAKFAKAWEGVEDKRFCPHPATWFNEQRYFDEAPYKVAQSAEKEPELFEKRYV